MVVQIRPDQIDGLVNRLGDEFYADRDAIRRAIDIGGSTNLVHRPSGRERRRELGVDEKAQSCAPEDRVIVLLGRELHTAAMSSAFR